MGSRLKKKRIIWLIILVAALYTAAELGLTAVIYGAVFSRYEAESVPECALEYVGVEFESGGDTLRGRLYECAGADTLIVTVPGLHAEAAELAPLCEALYEKGYSVLVFDPAGAGESEGDARGFVRIVLDADACISFAEENALFGHDRTVLLGHSRGGYAVCRAAAGHDSVAAVIAASAPDSAMDACIAGAAEFVGPAAYSNVGGLFIVQSLLFSPAETLCSASKSASEWGGPLLILQGSEDKTVPAERFSVYSKLKEPKEGVEALLIECGHDDILISEGEANARAVEDIAAFLRAVAVKADR